MPKTNIFAFDDLEYKDEYGNACSVTAVNLEDMAGNVENYQNYLPEEWAGSFRELQNYISTFGSGNAVMSAKEIAECRQIFEDTLESVSSYVNDNEARTEEMSEEEYQVYSYVKECLKDMQDIFDPVIRSMTGANELIAKYIWDMNHDEEIANEQEQFKNVGLIGHQPTIEECINMDPEKTDMDILVDRMLWLANDACCHQIVEGSAHIENLYGYTYNRLIERIYSMPMDKQAEFNIRLLRHRHALWENGNKKYEEIFSKIPENLIFESREYEKLAFNEIKETKECKEKAEKAYSEIDTLAKDAEEKNTDIKEIRQQIVSDQAEVDRMNNFVLPGLVKTLENITAFQNALNDVKKEVPEKPGEKIDYFVTTLNKIKNDPKYRKYKESTEHVINNIDTSKSFIERTKAKISSSESRINGIVISIRNKVKEVVDEGLLREFKKSPDFRKIQSKISKENYAKIMLSVTPEYRALESLNLLSKRTTGTDGRNYNMLFAVKAGTEDKLNQRPSIGIEGMLESEMDVLTKRFSHSDSEECRGIMDIADSEGYNNAFLILEEQRTGFYALQMNMAENYFRIASDTRKASKEFKDLKTALKKVFSHNLKESDSREEILAYYRKIQKAVKQIDVYLERHKHLKIDRRKDRVAWAEDIKKRMTLMRGAILKKLNKDDLQEAWENLKTEVDALKKPGAEKASSEEKLREAYARLVFRYAARKYPLETGKYEELFMKFKASKAFQAAFMKHNLYTLSHLTKNISYKKLEEKLEEEFKVIEDNQFLNNIPEDIAERYLTFIHNEDAIRQKGRFFDNITSDNRIAEIDKMDNIFGLSVTREACQTLALGEMLMKGITPEQAFDPFQCDAERRDAGRNVISAYTELGDEKLAEYCAAHFYTAMKSAEEFIGKKIAEMGEISIAGLTDPKNKDIFAAMQLLQDAAQEMERGKKRIDMAMKKLASDHPETYGDFEKVLTIQTYLAQFMGNLKTNTRFIIEQAIKYVPDKSFLEDDRKLSEAVSAVFCAKQMENDIRKVQSEALKDNTTFMEMLAIEKGQSIALDNSKNMNVVKAKIMQAEVTLKKKQPREEIVKQPLGTIVKQPEVLNCIARSFLQEQKDPKLKSADVSVYLDKDDPEKDSVKLNPDMHALVLDSIKSANRIIQESRKSQMANVVADNSRQPESIAVQI